MKKRLWLLLVLLFSGGCWTFMSQDYMKACQDTCAPAKVDRVSEYVCECQGDNETSQSDSENREYNGDHSGHPRSW